MWGYAAGVPVAEYGYSGGGLWCVLMTLFWVVVLGMIAVVALRALQRSAFGKSQRGESALSIVRERYARGEIDREEFEQKKKDLSV